MFEVEGGEHEWCMRILRHEAGHAIDNAFRLRLRRQRREIFGSPSAPYPEFYTPRPYSKSFVLHLDAWYAQSHPDEDFAETFAVWLTPNSEWRAALRRLAGAAEARIHGRADAVAARRGAARATIRPRSIRCATCRARCGSTIATSAATTASIIRTSTIATCAACSPTRRSSPPTSPPRSSSPASAGRCAASSPAGPGIYQYTIDQVLEDMIARCRELKLRLAVPEDQARQEFTVLLTVQAMNYLHSGGHRLFL